MSLTIGLVNYRNQNSTAGYQGDYAEKENIGSTNSFELRLYDARINRWMTIDPYGEYHSPYMSMGNNWVSQVDPDVGKANCPKCPDGYDATLVNDVNPAEFNYSGFGGSETDFTFRDFLDNLVFILNGGLVYQYQQAELGYPMDEPPQLIGALGLSGGSRLLSLYTNNGYNTFKKLDH